MRSTIFELTALLGVGLFLIGTICLVTVVIHSVFPAFEEQNLREINCTIASSNLDRKVKCAYSKRNLTRYPCLRIFVLCGKGLDHVDVKTNDSLERRQPLLLLKDIHSLDEQVRNSLRSWRYCVVVEWDLAAEPSRAAKPREIQPPRPYSLFLEHGSAAKTLISHPHNTASYAG